jgi:hypothetical protein
MRISLAFNGHLHGNYKIGTERWGVKEATLDERALFSLPLKQ